MTVAECAHPFSYVIIMETQKSIGFKGAFVYFVLYVASSATYMKVVVSKVGTVTLSAQLVSCLVFLLKVVKSLACDSSYPVLVVCHSHVDPRQVGIGTFYTMANSS